MTWLSWFRRSKDPDYETLLALLETRIQARESQLLSIQLRERRANALFITYGLGVWVVYVFLWWLGVVGGGEGVERAVGGLPVLGGPVVIIFTRRILRMWYKRQQDREEATLIKLKKEQREKVEELKKKTGYYSTRNLLEKYDEVIKKNTDPRNRGRPSVGGAPESPSPAGRPSAPNTPTRLPPPSLTGTPQQQQLQLQQFALQQQQQQQQQLRQPPTPLPKTLMDKLADALLGVAGQEESPNSKYALICGKCYTHNGLAIKEEWDTIQYQCPRCGYLNPRRTPLQSITPLPRALTPASALPSEAEAKASVRKASPLMEAEPEDTSMDDDEEDEDEEEREAIVLEDKLKASRLRQRGRRMEEDDMEIDS